MKRCTWSATMQQTFGHIVYIGYKDLEVYLEVYLEVSCYNTKFCIEFWELTRLKHCLEGYTVFACSEFQENIILALNTSLFLFKHWTLLNPASLLQTKTLESHLREP